jgi:hypothetical protein
MRTLLQLADTVMAVGVIQLRPQMERLLNLPADSLTKEVQLNQDVTSLLVDYQIPSDLLAYYDAGGGVGGGGGGTGVSGGVSGSAAPADHHEATPHYKVAAVKGFVASINTMIAQVSRHAS